MAKMIQVHPTAWEQLQEQLSTLTRERDEWHGQAIGVAEDAGRLREEVKRLTRERDQARKAVTALSATVTQMEAARLRGALERAAAHMGDPCESDCGEPHCEALRLIAAELAGEGEVDPLHPNGRCTCAGEGECEWCKRTEASLAGEGEALSAPTAEATWDACEKLVTSLLDEAKVPVPEVEDPETLMAERVAWLAGEWRRLRGAVLGAESAIALYRQTTPCSSDHRPGEMYEECRGCGYHVLLSDIRDALAGEGEVDPLHPNGRCTCAGEGECEWCKRTEASLAGEGEVEERLHVVDIDLDMRNAVTLDPLPVDEHRVGATRMLRFNVRRGEPIEIRMPQGRRILVRVDARYGAAATPEKARQA